MRNWIDTSNDKFTKYQTTVNNYRINVMMQKNTGSASITVIHPDRVHHHSQTWLLHASDIDTVEKMDTWTTQIAKKYKAMKINPKRRFNQNATHDCRQAFVATRSAVLEA